MKTSKEKLREKWSEEMFWINVFNPEIDYGAFESFANLFKEYGLKIEYCYSNQEVTSGIPPLVLGVPLRYSDRRKILEGQKPGVYFYMARKLRAIISQFDEEDLEVFEIYDEETEQLMASIYDPNDPNFMTSDDY